MRKDAAGGQQFDEKGRGDEQFHVRIVERKLKGNRSCLSVWVNSIDAIRTDSNASELNDREIRRRNPNSDRFDTDQRTCTCPICHPNDIQMLDGRTNERFVRCQRPRERKRTFSFVGVAPGEFFVESSHEMCLLDTTTNGCEVDEEWANQVNDRFCRWSNRWDCAVERRCNATARADRRRKNARTNSQTRRSFQFKENFLSNERENQSNVSLRQEDIFRQTWFRFLFFNKLFSFVRSFRREKNDKFLQNSSISGINWTETTLSKFFAVSSHFYITWEWRGDLEENHRQSLTCVWNDFVRFRPLNSFADLSESFILVWRWRIRFALLTLFFLQIIPISHTDICIIMIADEIAESSFDDFLRVHRWAKRKRQKCCCRQSMFMIHDHD